MKYKLLDSVVLLHDLPEFELRSGDLGTVVEVYEPDGLEVEFVKASGETLAVVTISGKEVSAHPMRLKGTRYRIKDEGQNIFDP